MGHIKCSWASLEDPRSCVELDLRPSEGNYGQREFEAASDGKRKLGSGFVVRCAPDDLAQHDSPVQQRLA